MLLLFLSAQARNLARAERNRSIHHMAEVRLLKPEQSDRSPFEQWAAICMLSWASLNKLAWGFTQIGKEKSEMAYATLWPLTAFASSVSEKLQCQPECRNQLNMSRTKVQHRFRVSFSVCKLFRKALALRHSTQSSVSVLITQPIKFSALHMDSCVASDINLWFGPEGYKHRLSRT